MYVPTLIKVIILYYAPMFAYVCAQGWKGVLEFVLFFYFVEGMFDLILLLTLKMKTRPLKCVVKFCQLTRF